MRLIWLVLAVSLLWGCGGAGGGGTAGSTVQPETVAVDFSTQAASAATVLYAAEFVLHLPTGVTIAADAASGVVAENVLQPVDATALAGARYQPAAAGGQATVRVNIVDPQGFTVGPLATLRCRVAPGPTVNGTGFSLDGFSAKDANGAVLPGITARFTIRPE